jgi:hypothetical protein
MDPDMVRQQEEAEREALAFLRAKPVAAVQMKPERLPQPEAAGQQRSAVTPRPAAATFEAMGSPAAPPFQRSPTAVLIEESAPSFEAEPQPERKESIAERFGRFISFGVAGAMLGGGLGIVAANYFQLSADLARIGIFVPAGFFSAVCAFASFFAKTPTSYRYLNPTPAFPPRGEGV